MRRWAPAAAAAAAVVVAAGGVVVARLASGDDGPAAAPPPEPAPVPTRAATLAELVVRDGDTVTGTGLVVVAPGRPARFCAAGGMRAGYPPSPPSCARGFDLAGAVPHRLDSPQEAEGVRWGTATITGRLSGRTITVTGRRAAPPAHDLPDLPEKPPCAPPEGGWRESAAEDPGAAPDRDGASLQRYVEDHPAEFGEVVVTYPDGFPSEATDAPGAGAETQVFLVTTVLDPPVAEARLRTVFRGNLCVRPAPRSRAEVDAVWRRIGGPPAPDAQWERHAIHQGGPDYLTGRVHLELLVVDAAVTSWLGQVDPDGLVDVRPTLRPAR